jgi:hypothetical protein
MGWYIWSIIIVLLILYIYIIQFRRGCYKKLFNDDLINSGLLQTGDIICFKAFNNFNSIFMGSYYGHIGIVYINPNDTSQTPMLFEANGIEHTPLKSYHSKDGIFLTPLAERMSKYKGRCFWKPLNKKLPESTIIDFKLFIDYSLNNMSYNYQIFQSCFKKWLGIERCNKKTNCGEIVFLSLIKLGLLPYNYHDISAMHHLNWMSNIKKLNWDYKYFDMIEVIEHPFAN